MGQRVDALYGRRRLRTRIGIAALVGTTCFGTVASEFSTASAAPAVQVSTSASGSKVREVDPVADIAVAALADLHNYQSSGDPSMFARYGSLRDGIATAIAGRLDIVPARMIAAWKAADTDHQTALMAALSQLGVPYHHNTSRAGEGFDCSGLTTYAWGLAGANLTRQSGAQIRAAAARTHDTATAGDLAYYPGHVMLYLGVDGAIVHAPNTGRNVQVDSIASRRSLRFGDPSA